MSSPEEGAGALPQPSIATAKGGVRATITKWVETAKPYKDLIGLISAVCVAVSAVVSFAVSYFATRTDITDLECRVFDHVEEKLGPARRAMGLATPKWH